MTRYEEIFYHNIENISKEMSNIRKSIDKANTLKMIDIYFKMNEKNLMSTADLTVAVEGLLRELEWNGIDKIQKF